MIRAGTSTAYWSGDKDEDLDGVAWYEQNSDGRTHAVGELRANDFGLHDMLGNTMEWCADAAGPGNRIFRGGCWGEIAEAARSDLLRSWVSTGCNGDLGFRPARAVTGD